MLSTFRIDSRIQICEFVLRLVKSILVSNSPVDFDVTGRLTYFSDLSTRPGSKYSCVAAPV